MRYRNFCGAIALIFASNGVSATASYFKVDADRVATACRAPLDARPALAQMTIEAWPGSAGDLPFLLVTDRRNGATVRIYHDPALRAFAMRKAACFGGELRLLSSILADERRGITWAPILFTADIDKPVRHDAHETRWPILVAPGHEKDLEYSLLLVIPHEEVHEMQHRRSGLPRWFAEGSAEWAGLQVTRIVAPALAAASIASRKADAAIERAPHLAGWGGTAIKRDAIRRQLSPEDQLRYDRDPNFDISKMSFSFGADDVEADLRDTNGLYGAALGLFQGLEERHGKAAVRGWVAAVLATPDASPVALAKARFGEDISALLR